VTQAASVAHVVVNVLLVLAGSTTAALARSALRYWWAQRAGHPYGLPVRHGGTVLRAAGASVAFAVTMTLLAVPEEERPPHSTAVPRFVAAPVPAPPRPPPAPPARKAPAGPPRTVGHPAHGTLQRLADGTRVWLPPQYAYPKAAGLAFPVVVAYVSGSAADDRDLFEGFATGAADHLADPFVLVLPARCGTGSEDPRAIARRYRALSGPAAYAVLGLGDRAACAVRDAWAHPGRYRAVAGVSGTYPVAPPPGDGTQLLLATASGDEAARVSARRFTTAMRGRGSRTEIRITDGAGRRRRVIGIVAGYFTEKLTGPDRIHP
jgi:hypothetical protein